MRRPTPPVPNPEDLRTKKAPPAAPYAPVNVTDDDQQRLIPGFLHVSDVRALVAVSQGVASEEQQKRAIAAIHKIARTEDMSYRPDGLGGDRDTVFAEGKRYVGLQLQKLVIHQAKYLND